MGIFDGTSPGMMTRAPGNYCLIMPCRATEKIADKLA